MGNLPCLVTICDNVEASLSISTSRSIAGPTIFSLDRNTPVTPLLYSVVHVMTWNPKYKLPAKPTKPGL